MLGYGRQSIDDDDIAAVAAVLRSSHLTQGPAVERFEAALAERVGARYAVAVSNGTAALHIACLAAGTDRGDRGVTAAITFVASANCLRYCGAEAAVVDIDPASLCMSPQALAADLARSPETKVVIPVDMAGLAGTSAEIRDVAGSRIIIEDACHALGGSYSNGQPVGCGRFADMTVFSFHPVKSITTGEGGAVLTNDAELARRLRLFRSHGIERQWDRLKSPLDEMGQPVPWYYEQQVLGYNYRLTDIQAALGITQLAKLDRFIARRREIAHAYDAAFWGMAHVTLPQSAPEQRVRSGLHLYLIRADWLALGTTRSEAMADLAVRGVGSQVHYIPLQRQPYHRHRLNQKANDCVNADRYYSCCLSLPLFPAMTDEDIERVIIAVREVMHG